MGTYTVSVQGSERLRFKADLAEASAPIQWINPLDEIDITPFQTADCRHSKHECAGMLNRWLDSEGGAAWDDGEDIEIDEI